MWEDVCVDNMETITSTESFIFSSSNNNYTRKVNQRSVRGEKVCGNHSLDVWLFFLFKFACGVNHALNIQEVFFLKLKHLQS